MSPSTGNRVCKAQKRGRSWRAEPQSSSKGQTTQASEHGLEPEQVGGWLDGHFGKLALGPQDPAWWARLGQRQLAAGEERRSPRTLFSSKPHFQALGCVTSSNHPKDSVNYLLFLSSL